MLYKSFNAITWLDPGELDGWRWPTGHDEPGEWMPPIEGPLTVGHAYRLHDEVTVCSWPGHALFEVEARDEVIPSEKYPDILLARQVRLLRRCEGWTEQVRYFWAADVVEHVLPIFRRRFPLDPRPQRVVDLARRVACGEPVADQLHAAGWAVDTCGPGATFATNAAAAAAYNLGIARDGAWAACMVGTIARDAVGWATAPRFDLAYACPSDCAGHKALRPSAERAEQEWQARKLHDYIYRPTAPRPPRPQYRRSRYGCSWAMFRAAPGRVRR